MLKKYKNLALYVLCALMLLSCLWLSWQGDAMETYIARVNFEQTEQGFLSTYRYDIKAGTYDVHIEYANSPATAPAQVVLYADLSSGAGNEFNKEYARFALPSTGGQYADTFTLPNEVSDLRVRVETDSEEFVLGFVQINAQGKYNRDTFLLLAAIILGGALWLLYRKSSLYNAPLLIKPNRIDARLAFAACILLGLCASYIQMNTIITDAHDFFFHTGRIDGIRDGLLAGQFPVRINTASSYGGGYANSIMYPELLLYPFALLRLFGASLPVTYKLLCLSINIAAAFVSYYAFRRLCRSDYMGMAASALYTMSLYRLANIYTRAAIGEALAMVFLPLIVLGLYEVCCGREKCWPVLTVGMWGVCASHTLSLTIAALFCALFVLANLHTVLCKKRLLAIGKAAGLCLLLCAWWLIPFLDFSTMDLYVFYETNDVSLHAAYVSQLFMAFPGTKGISLPLGETQGEMGLSVGLLLGLGALIYLLSAWLTRRGVLRQAERRITAGRNSLVFALLALWMATTLFPWQAVQSMPLLGTVLGSVQFPWRYLGFATVFLCVLCVLGVYAFLRTEQQKRVATVCIMLLSMVAAAPLFDRIQNEQSTYIPDRQYTMNFNGLDAFYYLRSTVARFGEKSTDDGEGGGAFVTFPQDDVTITDFVKTGTSLDFSFTTDEMQGDAYFDTGYYGYPGYTAWLNGERLETVRNNENDHLRVLLPEGTTGGTVKLRYTGKWFYRVGDALSLLTVIACIAWPILRKRRKSVETAEKLPKTV